MVLIRKQSIKKTMADAPAKAWQANISLTYSLHFRWDWEDRKLVLKKNGRDVNILPLPESMWWIDVSDITDLQTQVWDIEDILNIIWDPNYVKSQIISMLAHNWHTGLTVNYDSVNDRIVISN